MITILICHIIYLERNTSAKWLIKLSISRQIMHPYDEVKIEYLSLSDLHQIKYME